MPKYFFDHHSNTSIEIDDDGIDLPDVDAARRLALEALGQSVLDGAPRSLMGRLAIEVRDPHGPILRASATVVLEERFEAVPQTKGCLTVRDRQI